eukprot:TRINITY_DN12265_c0_g1_i1.p1 TRINITY_DN12265_c0_g1~~TRINITY_DN12265_c0_g1_i1.p1  ORF type:complete len:176 (-),score=48.56 TRINITY_DN12265_c0_g1_i1:48-575(-)
MGNVLASCLPEAQDPSLKGISPQFEQNTLEITQPSESMSFEDKNITKGASSITSTYLSGNITQEEEFEEPSGPINVPKHKDYVGPAKTASANSLPKNTLKPKPSQPPRAPIRDKASTPVKTEEEEIDYFADMQPKYVRPTIIEKKQASRLTEIELDTGDGGDGWEDNGENQGWDD